MSTINVASEIFPSCATEIRISRAVTLEAYPTLADRAVFSASTGACYLQTYMTAAELQALAAACIAAAHELDAKESA